MPEMNAAAIICEYNPFHNGHKYHIEETRRRFGATHIAAVMSGNFTQRGDAAIFDKWQRAETALRNGVDLVIELPVAKALSSAEQFAAGAVGIISAIPAIKMLSFGSECGDIELLKESAGAVQYAQEHDDFLGRMRRGLSYPAALQKTIEDFYTGDVVDVLTAPNNTLAVEYLKALFDRGSRVIPVTIERGGAAHDSGETAGKFASGSYLRNKILSGEYDAISEYMPLLGQLESGCAVADISRLNTAILAKLRCMPPEQLAKAPNISHGLEQRMSKAARIARSPEELLMLTKTKRYTHARLRRALLCAFLDISKADAKPAPAYIRILGMNDRGKEILRYKELSLPADTSLKALSGRGAAAKKQAMLEERTGNIYALCFAKPRACGLEFTRKPVIMDN